MADRQLSRDAWKERYRVMREIDRVERQHALQHFRNHWRSIVSNQLVVLAGNAFFGFAGGLAVFTLSVLPLLGKVSETVAKACGQ